MLKRKLCEAVITWKLNCKGPLLIKDERWSTHLEEKNFSKENGYPDCMFMSKLSQGEIKKTVPGLAHNPPMLSFFVPGTSIRGPFRARSEMIIRSLLPGDADPGFTACDPFEQNDPKTISCSKRLEKLPDGDSKYAKACPACKIFGCAGLASRISFTDADIKNGCKSVYRDMVGIDRFTGGAYKGAEQGEGGALMRFHVLEDTEFITTVRLTNFELWHMGLLAYVFRDFEQKLAPIGFGKTKGFGLVKGGIEEISLTYPAETDRVEHMYSLMTKKERPFYEIFTSKNDVTPVLEKKEAGLSLYQTYSVKNFDIFWQDAAKAFNAYINHLKDSLEKKGKTSTEEKEK